jgi:hypothetical protein
MRRIISAVSLAFVAVVSGCTLDRPGNDTLIGPDGIEVITEADPLADLSETKTRKAISEEISNPDSGPAVAPNPLEAAPPPMAGGPRQPSHYIFAYGGEGIDKQTGRPWCPAYVLDKPKLTGWANENGITVSEANSVNSRYAVLQFIDIVRDKPRRNLQFNPPDPALYPTYLVVSGDGREIWRHVGPVDLGEFADAWRLIEAD